jgi:signal transduction histidine kinase
MRTALIVVEATVIGWLLLRRTARRRARSSLEERLRFETLLSEVSVGLIPVAASQLGGALEHGLQRIAGFLDVDRARLVEYSDGGPGVRVSWAAAGVDELPRLMENGRYPWTAETVRRGHVVRFSRTDELPEPAATDRASYERAGTRSHISIPLHLGGPVLGVLSLEAVRAERTWSDVLVERLRLLSQAFAGALERKRMGALAAERLRFESLMSSLATTFSALSAVDFDREIHGALRRVTEFLGVAGGGVVEFTRDGRIAPARPDKDWIDAAGFPWLMARLQRGEVVTVSRPEELPDEAAVDRRSYLALRVKPQIAVPLVAGGTIVGGLVLSALGPERAELDDLIQRLRLLGDVFANALARKQGELEAQRLRQDLAHIGRVSAMGELTASLAHELNQPLTAILSNAQAAQRLLHAEVVNLDEIREILNDIVADDKRAGGIIRRLRGLLKKGDLEFAALDLNEIASEVAWLVRNDTVTRNVAMSLDLAPDLPRVRGDRAQLQQVVLNLVLNGLEAMQAPQAGEPTLVIRTTRDGATAVRLAVQDTGSGIDEAHVDRLFQPLHTTKPEGLGMGLAIARTIVEAHGGRLGAANNVRGGATFHFVLPAHLEDGP